MIPTALLTFDGHDGACLVTAATVRHGRDDPGAQPTASTLSCQVRGLLPAGIDIGSPVALSAELDGQVFPRFVGRVTDLATGWGDSIDDPVAEIIAAGPLASMGRRVVGDVPWGQELDGARVNRIIGLAGVPTDPARTDPGTVQGLPRDVDAQPALDLAQSAASDGGGIVWQAVDGAVLYADANHRRAAPVAAVLDSCTTPLGVRWQKTTEGLVNDVRIRYGPAVDGADQAELHATRPESITTRGTYAASLTTQLADATAAQVRADVILARQSEPAWLLAGLDADLELLTRTLTPAADLAQSLALLGLDVGDLVSLTGLPAGSPYTSALLFVEGWLEQIVYGGWRTSLVVSDYCRTAPPPRWDDVDPSYTWDNVSPSTVRTNLITNPLSGTASTGYNQAPAGGAVTIAGQTGQTGWARGTTTSTRGTFTAPSTSVSGPVNYQLPVAAVAAVTPGQTYGFLAQYRVSRSQRMMLQVSWRNDAGTSVGTATGDTAVLAANTVGTYRASRLVAPAGATRAYLFLYAVAGTGGTLWAAGDWAEYTNLHAERTDRVLTADDDPATGIFTGALPDTPVDDYAWTGAAHGSQSRREHWSAPPLTWDGITCLPPYLSLGRWIDVPSTTRWDTVPAGTTWQTWEG